ncbi:MAG: HIT family protein [Actinomycetota bacterium]|nr:HIT family protein [Acidimicrobiia bacterium]MDQ3293020.1 HIT family protein [Actinomycetota bacterium]
MATLFTRIIEGELPGRFVWRDDRCVAFLSIGPINPGHTLVVPIAEVDHWIDVEPATMARCAEVAQLVGKAVQAAFGRSRVGLMVAGLEVPHTHLHVIPFDTEGELRFERARPDTPAEELDDAAERIRSALRDLGETPAT